MTYVVLFGTVATRRHARLKWRKIATWRTEYNEQRPHSSLGYKTPSEFAAQAASFYTAEREARDSDAIPCPSRSPIPAQTGRGLTETCRILT